MERISKRVRALENHRKPASYSLPVLNKATGTRLYMQGHRLSLEADLKTRFSMISRNMYTL